MADVSHRAPNEKDSEDVNSVWSRGREAIPEERE